MEIKEFFEPVLNFIKGFQKKEKEPGSKQAAKDRLKLVLMQDRASVSPDFFDMMKQEIIDVIKKYIEIDEESLEVELTRGLEAGLEGPALYANIPIRNVKPVAPKSEENSALSEEEADKLADAILDNIEAAASGGTELENDLVKDDSNSDTEADKAEENFSKARVEVSKAEEKDSKTEAEVSKAEESPATEKTDASGFADVKSEFIQNEELISNVSEEAKSEQKKEAAKKKSTNAKSTSSKSASTKKASTKKKKAE